jgi:hypothetical protein
MNFFSTVVAASVAYLSIAGATQAQDIGDKSVAFGLSTFGPTLEGTYQIDQKWRLRGAVMGGLSYSETETEDDNSYDVDAKLGALALLADYYPTTSGFRVSGGLLLNTTKVDATTVASAGSPFMIDDGDGGEREFTSGSVTARGEFAKRISPMITTGYDYRFSNSWMLSGEIGAVYTGGIDLTAKGSTTDLQDAIDASDDYRDARRDASDITFYPYISVMVGYRF